MITRADLLKRPTYLLNKYQNEIFRQLTRFMKNNNLNKGDIAERLGVSNPQVSQILNGNTNFTLKTLIKLGLLIGKVPDLRFISFEDYWAKEEAIYFTPKIQFVKDINDSLYPSNKRPQNIGINELSEPVAVSENINKQFSDVA